MLLLLALLMDIDRFMSFVHASTWNVTKVSRPLRLGGLSS